MKPSGDGADVEAVEVPAQPTAPEVEATRVEAARVEAAPADAGAELTERDRGILAFEHRWWRRPGAKEQAIRDTFDLSATRYYQILNGLLDNPAALAHDPVTVGRLRRLRAARTRR